MEHEGIHYNCSWHHPICCLVPHNKYSSLLAQINFMLLRLDIFSQEIKFQLAHFFSPAVESPHKYSWQYIRSIQCRSQILDQFVIKWLKNELFDQRTKNRPIELDMDSWRKLETNTTIFLSWTIFPSIYHHTRICWMPNYWLDIEIDKNTRDRMKNTRGRVRKGGLIEKKEVKRASTATFFPISSPWKLELVWIRC